MNRQAILFLVLAMVLFLVAAIAATGVSDRGLPWFELVLTWTPRALGVLIAAIAAFALLHRSLTAEALDRQLPLVFPLFAGLLLISINWSVVVVLGAICVAVMVKQFLGRSTTPPAEGGGTS